MMIRERSFRVLVYMGASDSTALMKTICEQEEIPCSTVADREAFLESFLDEETDLIVLDTDVGEEEIIAVLEVLKRDALYRAIPTVVISKRAENDAFALRLSEYAVIAVLTYENRKYQCQRLLAHLKCLHDHAGRIHGNFLQSESHNIIDPLTGALNRFGAENRFQNLVGYYASNQEAFSIIILDVDHFKSVNDTHGHSRGDQVLVEISALIKNSIRKDDALIRFGGEEFIVFLSDADIEVAKERAEKLRELIESTPFSDSRLHLTASFGVVEYTPGESMDLLIEKADKLMYEAKAEGRNRICFA